MKTYALLLRKYTDEYQLAAWATGLNNENKLDELQKDYERKVARLKKRIHRTYGIDDLTFLTLKEQAMTL